MIYIDENALEEGLVITGRNNKTLEAKAIRIGVHSFTNHNAMVVKKGGKWFIAEAKPPVSALTPISDYERLMNEDGYLVRFYRLQTLGKVQRRAAAAYFVDNLIGLPYPNKKKMVLLAMPIYNALVDKTGILPPIRLTWCSELLKRACISQNPDCLDGYAGKKKALFTPKTIENRIMFGIFRDVTDNIVQNR